MLMQQGCFPLLSFLHVPGKMSRPVWLMMGTAFRFQLPPLRHEIDALPACTSNTTTESANTTHSPLLFLTCKHTLVPWDFVSDASALRIPTDYRKSRFVIGKLYLIDAARRRAQRAGALELRIVALHPHLDVALLRAQPCAHMFEPHASTWRVVHEAPTLTLSTHYMESKDKIQADGRQRAVCAKDVPWPCNTEPADGVLADAAPSSLGDVTTERGYLVGFRGSGRLGEVDTMDASVLQKLSTEERAALLAELSDVEGKQEPVVASVRVVDARGMCRGWDDARDVCYHGMSGAPLLLPCGASSPAVVCEDAALLPKAPMTCAGVLYGKHVDFPQNIGFTPVGAFLPWLRDTMAQLSSSHGRDVQLDEATQA